MDLANSYSTQKGALHSMKKVLTIVVPAYNVEKYLKNCLDSFVDVNILNSIEILVVDDGSTDKTEDMVQLSITPFRGQQESILKLWMVMTGWIKNISRHSLIF